jgi:TonB family protein
MKRLISPLIFFWFTITITMDGNAQGNLVFFDQDFTPVKKEKKATYISKNHFKQQGEETLVLLALDGSGKISVTFSDGKFIRKEPIPVSENMDDQKLAEYPAEDYLPFNDYDQAPVPNGGIEAFQRFVVENVVYPKKAKAKGIQGRVFVQFLVSEEGEVTHISVAKGIDPKIDAEAVKLIKEFGDKVGWTPGSLEGEAVTVHVIVPILFVQ